MQAPTGTSPGAKAMDDHEEREAKAQARSGRESKISSASWGLFFIWIGVVWLADLGLGVGLLGVSVLLLGTQYVRRLLGFELEAFGIVAGLCVGIGGLWKLFGLKTDLVPVLLIVVGALMIVTLLLRRQPAG